MDIEKSIMDNFLQEQEDIKNFFPKTIGEIKNEIIKAKKAEIGTISTHGGVKVRKEANGWVPVKGGEETPKGEDQPAEKTGEPADLGEHAKGASEAALQNAIKNSPDSEVRAAAHRELERRNKEEKTEMFGKPDPLDSQWGEPSEKTESDMFDDEVERMGGVVPKKKEAKPKPEPKKEEPKPKKLSAKAENFLDAVKIFDNKIKLDDITVEGAPRGGWIVYHKGKELGVIRQNMLDEDTIDEYELRHMNTEEEPTKGDKRPESEVVSSASSFRDYLKDQNINQLSYGGTFYVDKKDYKTLVDQFKDVPGYYSYDKGSIVGERFTFGTGFGVLPSRDMQKEKDRLTKLESKFEASIDKDRERAKEKLEKLKQRVPMREDINKKHSWNFSEKGYQKLIEDYHQEMMETGSTYNKSDFLNFADVADLPEYFEKSLSEDRHTTYKFLEGQSTLLQKSHINEFILSDSFSVSKTGIELKQRFEEQLKMELEEIRENSRKAAECLKEIGEQPTESFEDEYYYMIDGYEDKIQQLPMVFSRGNESVDLADKKWDYNGFARKMVDGMIEVLHLNTLLNTIVDGKQYKLTVKQASILGY